MKNRSNVLQCTPQNIKNWFSYQRKQFLRRSRIKNGKTNTKSISLKVEKEAIPSLRPQEVKQESKSTQNTTPLENTLCPPPCSFYYKKMNNFQEITKNTPQFFSFYQNGCFGGNISPLTRLNPSYAQTMMALFAMKRMTPFG